MSVRSILLAAVMAFGTCTALWPAPPEVCRIQGGHTKLIFGTGFDPQSVAVHVWSPAATKEELMRALEEAAAAGLEHPGAELPSRPPEDAKQVRILETDPKGRNMAAEFHSTYDASGYYDATLGPEVCWVENADGFSPPRLVRSARPWWVYPERARAGDRIRIFGRNLSERWRQALVALVSENGKVLPLEATGKVRHPIYERSLKLPADLPPGRYKVYVHNQAGGSAGWSRPLSLVVSDAPESVPHMVDARAVGAKGNGIEDDTEALRRALRQASAPAGGVVLLPPGRYPISAMLEVPEGVSLRGAGAGNSIVEVIAEHPMQAGFPRGPDLEGLPRDWLPHLQAQNAPPMVWLRHRSSLSDLTLRSGPGVASGVLVARCPGVAEDVRIERCIIRITHEADGWVPEVPLRVAGDTYGFVVRECRLEGRGGIDVLSTSNRYAYIGDNEVRAIPNGQGNLIMLRGMNKSVVENNILRDGNRNFVAQLGASRGKDELRAGQQPPAASFYHNILLGNMLYNTIPRRHNAGETMYEGPDAYWRGRPLEATAETLTVPGEPFWTDMTGSFVLVLDGRGFGQYRQVVASTAKSLTVSPPWEVVPDASTYLMVNGAFAENLWIDNTEEHTANWSGFWGFNIGHVVDGHILRDGLGFYLWGWKNDNPSPVAFNEIIGSHISGRGNINMIGSMVFANTVRFSEVVDFRQRPSFHIQPTWLGSDPQQRRGIDIGTVHEAMEGMPATAPFKDWNLVEGSNIYDGPLGVYIAPRARHTILKNNAIHVDSLAILDESGSALVE